MTNLSIIIVSYNVKDLLINCLRSVFLAGNSLRLEVFVVDNASNDGTVEAVQSLFPTVRLLTNSANLGFPKANNQALSLCSGDVTLLLNPDTIVHQDALLELMSFFREQKNGAVAGLNVRNTDGTCQNSFHTELKPVRLLLSLFEINKLFKNSHILNPDAFIIKVHDKPTKVGWVTGASLAFERKVYEVIGGLDENLFWIEDADFCLRANKAGFHVYYLYKCIVTHFMGSSAKSNRRRVIFHQHVSKIKFMYKHYGFFWGIITEAIIVTQLLLKIFVRLLQSLYPPKRQESINRYEGYLAAIVFILTRRPPSWIQ